MTTATNADAPIPSATDERPDEATRRNTRAGVMALTLMPITMAVLVALIALWLTAPLR